MDFTSTKNKKALDAAFLITATLAALALRFCLLPFESGDWQQFLHGWYKSLAQNGGVLGVGKAVGDYMPPYFYLLGLLTYLPLPALWAVKLLSIGMDLVLAVMVRKLVGLRFSDALRKNAAYFLTLFIPSVFLNSAAWAQCDVIFVSALLACLYCLAQKKDGAAMLWFSVSFVFKLQAIFLAPLILLYLLKGRVRWRMLLCFPVVYLLAVLPAAVMGQNFFSLLTVYFRQAGQYNLLSMYLPNLWTWVFGSSDSLLGAAGVMLAGGVVLMSLYFLLRVKFSLSAPGTLISLAFFYALLVPYFLPYMHERYFYLADILGVVFAFYYPKKWYCAAILCLASANAVCHNLFGTEFMPVQVWSLLVLFVLFTVSGHLIGVVRGEKELKEGVSG